MKQPKQTESLPDPLGGLSVYRHPEHVAAADKLRDLQARQRRIGEEIADHEGRAEKLAADIERQATAMLDADPEAATAILAAEVKSATATVEALRRDEAVTKRAIQIAEQRLEALRNRLSRECCAKLSPIRDSLTRELYHAEIAFKALIDKATRFDGRMNAEGIIPVNILQIIPRLPMAGDVIPDGRETTLFQHRVREAGLVKE